MEFTYAFEKLSVWQQSRQFAVLVYEKTRAFPRDEIFGMTNQIRRASISICCNLAEGSARVGPTDQARFYEIAFGSAVEVMNLLILSTDLGYISNEEYAELRSQMERLTYNINRLSSKKPPTNPNKPQDKPS
jgi:four helix bundle protein